MLDFFEKGRFVFATDTAVRDALRIQFVGLRIATSFDSFEAGALQTWSKKPRRNLPCDLDHLGDPTSRHLDEHNSMNG